MALVVTVPEGGVLIVGDEDFVVERAWSQDRFVLRGSDGTLWDVVDDRMSEVSSGVFIGAGMPRASSPPGHARLLIEAPRSVPIRRQRRGKDRDLR